MSITPSLPPPPAPPPTPRAPDEITIVSHSNLFYWWPIWALGYVLALLTYFGPHAGLMVVVPKHSKAVRVVEGKGNFVQEDNAGKKQTVVEDLTDREAIVLPKDEKTNKPHELRDRSTVDSAYPAQPRLHCVNQPTYGVVFVIFLLVVIVITNVPLRGMWSVVVIITGLLMTIIFALAGWWDTILRTLSLLDIRINAGGYVLLSSVLLALWLVTILFFDRQMYIVFTPGQLRVCTEIGGGEKVYDTTGLRLEKQRSDLFRHWVLGLGSGDLVVRTAGAGGDHIDLHNVLFIGKKVKLIEEMLQRRKVIETRGI